MSRSEFLNNLALIFGGSVFAALIYGMTNRYNYNLKKVKLGRIRVRSYDIPAYKCAADALLLDAGVQLLFHAQAAGVAMAGEAHIDSLLVHLIARGLE